MKALENTSETQPDTEHHGRTDRPQRRVRRAAPAYDLALRHRQGVSLLLSHRDDLRGVHAFADVLEEAVRWSA